MGSQGDASSSDASPDSIDRWNRYTKLGPFFSASSFDRNFRPNNNQTFIVYVKSTLVLYRKGLCGFFPVLGFALEEKLRGAKCCKYYGPEGVIATPAYKKDTRKTSPYLAPQRNHSASGRDNGGTLSNCDRFHNNQNLLVQYLVDCCLRVALIYIIHRSIPYAWEGEFGCSNAKKDLTHRPQDPPSNMLTVVTIRKDYGIASSS